MWTSNGNGTEAWRACCPAHDDARPSLDIDLGDGKILLICRSRGCTAQEIVAADGRPTDDNQPEFEATYDYRDENGDLAYQVVRKPGKKFTQRKPAGSGWARNLNGVRRIPYHLPELLAADKVAPVFVCEGKKDCDALARVGLRATTNPGGAGNWKVLDGQAVQAASAAARW
jgi:hypothetical protein